MPLVRFTPTAPSLSSTAPLLLERPSQITLAQNRSSHYISLIDPSKSGNRLVQYEDGRIELISKSFVEVVGERLLMPALVGVSSLLGRGFAFMKAGFVSLDNVVMRAFDFLPKAEASMLVSDFMGRVRQGGYANLIHGLTPDEKIKFLKNHKLQANYLALETMLTDLGQFIASKSHGYANFRGEMQRYCESFQNVEQNLKYILEDLTQSDLHSTYSPMSQKKLQLTFPRCTLEKASRGTSETKIRAVSGGIYEDGREMPYQGQVSDEESPCAANPIEMALLDEVMQRAGGVLGALRIDGNSQKFSYNQFEQIFDDDVIAGLKTTIEQIQKHLDASIGNVETFVAGLIAKRQAEVDKNIRRIIHNICVVHKQIVSKFNREHPERKISFNPDRHRVESSLNLEWEIQEEIPAGWVTSAKKEILFSFNIRGPRPDEIHKDVL